MKRLLAFLVVLFLTACGPTEGTVVDKQFYPDHTDIVPAYTYDSKGNVSGMYVNYVYTPPCWEIFLRKGDETGDHCIDREEWNKATLGSYYKIPE